MSQTASRPPPSTQADAEKRAGQRRPATGEPAWRVTAMPDWASTAASLDESGTGLARAVFQTDAWLSTWYATMGAQTGVTALPLVVRAAGDDRLAVVLPLIRRRGRGLATVEFADLGVTDYNAPVLGPAAPTCDRGAASMWQAVRAALAPADLVRFDKMPAAIEGRPNPLCLLSGAAPGRLSGNVIELAGSWEDYLAGLPRKVRKELGRSLRVFEREAQTRQSEGGRFEHLTEPASAHAALDAIEALQSARIREIGLPYVLDAPAHAAFYRTLVGRGLARGATIVTTLRSGTEIVGALLGVADEHRRTYAMVRLAHAGGVWAQASPGRLMIERTMHHLYAEGFRRFDMTIGDYPFKLQLGPTRLPLFELTAALSWRAVPFVAGLRTLAAARKTARALGLRRPGVRRHVPARSDTTGDGARAG